MFAIALLFGLATVAAWSPVRRAIPSESLLAGAGAAAIMIVLLAFGHAG